MTFLLEAETSATDPQDDGLWALLQETPDLLCWIDATGQVERTNPAAAEALGSELGRPLLSWIHEADRDEVSEALKRPGPVRFRCRCLTTVLSGYRVLDWQGAQLPGGGLVLLGRDVTGTARLETALRQTEIALRQAQKLEALGQLAGGIAHDFNNVLTVIMSHAELVLMDRSADPTGDMQAIIQAIGRAQGLAQRLLQFSRRGTPALVVKPLDRRILDIQQLLGQLLASREHLRLDLGAGDAAVQMEEGTLTQLLLNLVINARDAMEPQGGMVTVQTRPVTLTAPLTGACSGSDLLPGAYLRLSVHDEGSGMSPELIRQIFEPFYTTKPRGRGSGLGLAVCADILHRARASIFVQSTPGVGSTFSIYFPPSPPLPR